MKVRWVSDDDVLMNVMGNGVMGNELGVHPVCPK